MFRSFLARRPRPSTVLAVHPRVDPLEDRRLLSFSPAVPYPTGNHPFAVAVADFNGDGTPDLAVADQSANSMSILLGNSDGTFRAAVDYPAGLTPAAVAVGDVNGDGNLDVIVANQGNDPSNSSLSIFLGNGDGTFQSAMNYFGFKSLALAVAVGDFNNDGNLDLAVANNGVTILLGNGDGTFRQTNTYGSGFAVAVGDVNNDGNLDLVTNTFASNSVGVLLGHGDGTFQLANTYTFPKPTLNPVLADFNNDGNLDLAVVSGSPNNQVGVFLGNGDGSFQSPSTLAAGNSPQTLAAADFDGDGNLDLAVVTNSDHSVNVQLGQGDGTFISGGTFDTGGLSPNSVAMGDFNGDGSADLVVTNGNSNTVGVLLNAVDWNTQPGITSQGRRDLRDLKPLGMALMSTIQTPEVVIPAQAATMSAQGRQMPRSADSASVTMSDHLQTLVSALHRAHSGQPDQVADVPALDDELTVASRVIE